MLPPRYAPYLFGFLLSGLMTLIVSGIVSVQALGVRPETLTTWMESWLTSWVVAFPTVLFVAPAVRRLTERLTRSTDGPRG